MLGLWFDNKRGMALTTVIASEAKQSIFAKKDWIASLHWQ
jgi:hypothetical protein